MRCGNQLTRWRGQRLVLLAPPSATWPSRTPARGPRRYGRPRSPLMPPSWATRTCLPMGRPSEPGHLRGRRLEFNDAPARAGLFTPAKSKRPIATTAAVPCNARRRPLTGNPSHFNERFPPIKRACPDYGSPRVHNQGIRRAKGRPFASAGKALGRNHGLRFLSAAHRKRQFENANKGPRRE